jgi:predicted metal-dependent enzyme (double-stranded beta helix superfamily)
MLDIDRFVSDCRSAKGEGEKAVREVVRRAVENPAALMKAVGEPTGAGVRAIHHSGDLTILDVVWAPLMCVMPHDHQMWAVIGIYTGGEDNVFWRRIGNRIEAAGALALRTGDVAPLGWNIVHSVTNPIEKLTGSIHVYGGNFFTKKRSEWNPETLREEPYDLGKNDKYFADANALYKFMTDRARG